MPYVLFLGQIEGCATVRQKELRLLGSSAAVAAGRVITPAQEQELSQDPENGALLILIMKTSVRLVQKQEFDTFKLQQSLKEQVFEAGLKGQTNIQEVKKELKMNP